MTQKNSPEDDRNDDRHQSHWLLWLIVWVVIIAAIGGMWAVDYYFSPEINNASVLPEAVGK